ncbi:hypothetical protein [Cupriavidus sp. YAF13]|uniref:hypothetical protein n=1 Tax=Cupriavidus sp. YAF13 TaxID=3233075 RepID=UPI003F93190A
MRTWLRAVCLFVAGAGAAVALIFAFAGGLPSARLGFDPQSAIRHDGDSTGEETNGSAIMQASCDDICRQSIGVAAVALLNHRSAP